MADPVAQRPNFGEGYEAAADAPFDPPPWSTVAARLAAARNYWLTTVRSDGRPHAMPVWGLWRDDTLWFGTGPVSVKGRNLARDPRAVAHLESGDDVVVVEGTVELLPDELATDQGFLDEYGEKYDLRPTADFMLGAAWRLTPVTVLAWDERTFVDSQVRYRFD